MALSVAAASLIIANMYYLYDVYYGYTYLPRPLMPINKLDIRMDGPCRVLYIGKRSICIDAGEYQSCLCYPYPDYILAGKACPLENDCAAYRIQDIALGDEVVIKSFRTERDGQWYLYSISLLSKGDGGIVIASQRPDPKRPYHVWQNYLNNWHHRDIAIPDAMLAQYGQACHPEPTLQMRKRWAARRDDDPPAIKQQKD